MGEDSHSLEISAVQEFRAARLQASLERIRAVLTGKSADLLSYDEVREKVRAQETQERQLKEIPLDAIVGSVGRYTDFTRRFFPRQEGGQQRWTRIRMQMDGMAGLPPIEAYQLGEVYFVIDGNHRVSVARSVGARYIEGFVTQVQTSVPISKDVNLDKLIITERYVHFLEATGLKNAFPDADFEMSAAGNYRFLENQIFVHQEWMGGRVSYKEAAADWYRTVYCPVVQIVHRRGMMRDFPRRTETDLYVWIGKHRHDLAERLGWNLQHEVAAADLVDTFSQAPGKILKRAGQKMMDAIIPDALEAGPMPGSWRKVWLETHQDERLFRHILVAINGKADGWHALEQTLFYARHENSRVYGLHVIPEREDEESERFKSIRAAFEQQCRRAGVTGEISVETGSITRLICDSARWMDLVVASLAHPPGPQALDRLGSGFRQLLQRCPRPVLIVPQGAVNPSRLLLAYDGSPTSNEATFIAAYMAKQWGLPLTVVSVITGEGHEDVIRQAQSYLEDKGVSADYNKKRGQPPLEIIQVADQCNCDLILMGSYGHNPLLEIALGSVVDEVLRGFCGAVLVCR